MRDHPGALALKIALLILQIRRLIPLVELYRLAKIGGDTFSRFDVKDLRLDLMILTSLH